MLDDPFQDRRPATVACDGALHFVADALLDHHDLVGQGDADAVLDDVALHVMRAAVAN